jgi:signal transduction histidine kinase
MMRAFLADNSKDLIERCRARATQRPPHGATPQQLQNGVPMFLDQLLAMLDVQETAESMGSRELSGSNGGEVSGSSPIGKSAARYGRTLFELGYSIDLVVHEYGDLCQAIMELAYEREAPFSVSEFRTLNRCLDNAIADAVTEFSYQRDLEANKNQTLVMSDRLGILADDLRGQLGTAALAFAAARAGSLNLSGATGSVLERALISLQNLVNTAMAEVRLSTQGCAKFKLFPLADLIAEVRNTATVEAQARGSVLTVPAVDTGIYVDVDRHLLLSAVGALLQNAFEFSDDHTEVILNAYSVADRVLIDVVDNRGGLPPGAAEKMFLPYTQTGEDKSKLESGLSIAWRSVESNNGVLSVRDVPGTGCIFTINLPRQADNGNARRT